MVSVSCQFPYKVNQSFGTVQCYFLSLLFNSINRDIDLYRKLIWVLSLLYPDRVRFECYIDVY